MLHKTKRFPISISVEKFAQKPTNEQWRSMKYELTYLDINELADKIKLGYNFCHYYKNTDDIIFGNREKRTDNFKETFIVCFDIDKSEITYKDFYQNITYKPSFSYTTPSNITGEDNRYRLIYQFSQPVVSNDFYKILFDGIIDNIRRDIPNFELVDKSCRNVTQQMGGNALPHIEYFLNNIIYQFSDFTDNISSNSAGRDFPKLSSGRGGERYADAVGKPKEKEVECTEFTDQEFKNDFFNITDFTSYISFREKYINKYPIIDQTPYPIADDDTPLIKLPDDFTAIKRDWLRVADEKRDGDVFHSPKRVKIRKGRRHRILFTNAMLRRKILPDITFEHLLFCLVYERQEFIDNTDKAITNMELYKICKNAFNAKEITIKIKKDKRKHIVNESFCEKYGYSKQQIAAMARESKTTNILEKEYQPHLSVKENLQFLSDKGYSIGKSTVYRYCKANGISTKDTTIS